MRYAIVLDTGATVRLDAPNMQTAAEMAHGVHQGLGNRTAAIAEIVAVGSRHISDGWQAEHEDAAA